MENLTTYERAFLSYILDKLLHNVSPDAFNEAEVYLSSSDISALNVINDKLCYVK